MPEEFFISTTLKTNFAFTVVGGDLRRPRTQSFQSLQPVPDQPWLWNKDQSGPQAQPAPFTDGWSKPVARDKQDVLVARRLNVPFVVLIIPTQACVERQIVVNETGERQWWRYGVGEHILHTDDTESEQLHLRFSAPGDASVVHQVHHRLQHKPVSLVTSWCDDDHRATLPLGWWNIGFVCVKISSDWLVYPIFPIVSMIDSFRFFRYTSSDLFNLFRYESHY